MLYLFSSNAQPQYSQDILNVISAPRGHRMTFRYEPKYVDERAKAAWATGLNAHSVLIHFVLQQQNHYFIPVLFPVRSGTIIKTRFEGGIHLVDFCVEDFISLHDPDVMVDSVDDGRDTFYDYPARTAAYRKVLEDKGLPVPYGKYSILHDYDAVADSTISGLVRGSDSTSASVTLRSTTEYLVRTETFASARFASILSLHNSGDSKPEEITAPSYGYKLTSGREYRFDVLQLQPQPVDTTSVMSVVLDGKTLQSIGPSDLSIGSQYDLQTVRIVVLPTTTVQYTTIGLRPGPGVQGPALDIPVEIHPPAGRNAAMAIGTTAGLILLGLSSIFSSIEGWQKFALVAGGALLASFMNTFQLSSKSL